MRVQHLSDPTQFAPAAQGFLLANEAENNLILGLFTHLARGRRDGKGDPALYIVRDDSDSIVGVALWAGYQLILSRATPESHDALADHLATRNTRYPKASGPAPAVAAFALADLSRTSHPHAPGPVMHLMQATTIHDPPRPAPGHARLATPDDLPLACQWSDAFTAELNLEAADRSARVLRWIQDQEVFFWCNPDPVSMALIVGRSPNGARIGSVYTPPDHRNRGYASAAVAYLARRLLAQGQKFVYLYAESTNPTSNHIYQALGFHPVCDWQEFDLNPTTP